MSRSEEGREEALAEGTVHVGKTRRLSKGTILVVAAGFIAAGAALSGAAWESYRTSQREARIFAGLSADAFKQGFCDRALRLAVAGLPPLDGAFPLSFRSPVLQGELSSFGSMQDCYFQLALAGHTGLVNSAAFSPDGSRIVTASWFSARPSAATIPGSLPLPPTAPRGYGTPPQARRWLRCVDIRAQWPLRRSVRTPRASSPHPPTAPRASGNSIRWF
jgi:hypothetical protein